MPIGNLASADEMKTVQSWVKPMLGSLHVLLQELSPSSLRLPWAGQAWEWPGVSGHPAGSTATQPLGGSRLKVIKRNVSLVT